MAERLDVREAAMYAFVVVAFVLISIYSSSIQSVTVTRYMDGDEYFAFTEQLASGTTIRAEAPYIYRVGLPWLVAHLYPQDIAFGFWLLNTVAAFAGVLLLVLWLRGFAISRGLSILMAVLYMVQWVGPTRFVPYYPTYVDPPFIAFAFLGLILIHKIWMQFSWTKAALLVVASFIGSLFRETMIFIPLSFLFVTVRLSRSDAPRARVPMLARALPLVASIGSVILCHTQPAQPRRTISMIDNAVYLFERKPLWTLPLAVFITFGPIVTLAVYEWRKGKSLLSQHVYLLVYVLGCALTGYVGGHETERYFLWAAPLVYLLVARAIASNRESLLHSAWVFMALVCAQALSARIFWGIPDPSMELSGLNEMPDAATKAAALINRLLVIDSFHGNLWSYFGSRPFHVLRLFLYAAFSAFLIWWLERRKSEQRHEASRSTLSPAVARHTANITE